MFQNTNLIFSLNPQTLYSLITLSVLILATALTFAIFKALTFGLVLLLPAPSLLSPIVKQVTGILILLLSLGFYLSVNQKIAQNGFEIPDSLIDTALKVSQPSIPVQGFKYDKTLMAQITPDQLELLKKNPELLKQYGIDPKTLDSLPVSVSTPDLNTTAMIKPLVKDQLQNIIKPYQNFIAPILALLFFLTLQSLTALLGLFISPILWLIFLLLEKTNFIHFETEMREVKKLVV